MEIILLEKIRNLGGLGDKVNVKAGYARNFLVPQDKAVYATEANVAEFEARRAELEKAAAETLKAAQARAEKVAAIAEITLSAQASEEGKLFGSINVREVADALTAAGAEVEKHEVSLPNGAIHELGEHPVHILLHSDVTVEIKVNVEAIA